MVDSLGIRYAHFTLSYSFGRWLTPFVVWIRTDYTIPWVIGVFTMMYLAISVALTVSILEIKKPTFVIATSFLMVSFPALAYSFSFDFIADVLTLALLLSVLAVYYTKKYKHGYWLGAVFLALSLSLYQSFLGFTMGLIVILLIKHIVLYPRKSVKFDFCIFPIKCLLCGVIGLFMYLASVQLSLSIVGSELLDYRGISSMGVPPLGDLLGIVARSFIWFFSFFVPSSHERSAFFFVTDALFAAYFIAFIVLAFCLAKIFAATQLYKQVAKMLMVVTCLFILPVCLNIMDVLMQDVRTDALHIYQFVLGIVLVLVVYDLYEIVAMREGKTIKLTLQKWALLGATLFIATSYFVTTGLYYYRLHIVYERTYAFHNRMLARIESTNGFTANTPIAIIGDGMFFTGVNHSEMHFPTIVNDRGIPSPTVTLRSNEVRNNHNFTVFVSHYLDVQLNHAGAEDIERLRSNNEFIEMAVWPHYDSVRYIDGFIVVKLNPSPFVKIEQIYGNLYHIYDAGTPIHVAENLQYFWNVFREDELVHATDGYLTGHSSFEFRLTEGQRYRFQIFVRTQDLRFLDSGSFSDWYVFTQ